MQVRQAVCTGLLVGMLLCAASASGEIVYNVVATTPTDAIMLAHEQGEVASYVEDPRGAEFNAQVAQKITLSGTARRLTQVQAWIGGFNSTVARAVQLVPVLRIYAPDGSGVGSLPGELLWEGRAAEATITFTGTSPSARVPVVFNMDLRVPGVVFLAVSHETIRVNGPLPWPLFGNACVINGAPSTVADPWLVLQSTTTMQWRRDPAGPSPNFALQARISAAFTCLADFDDGTGRGIPDGGVTVDDLLYYLALFADGDVRADVDDGTMTARRDGGVTIDDLLYFLVRFDLGC